MLPNGRPNIQKTGIPIFERLSWYHTLIDLSTGKFLLVIFTSFLVVNLVFGLAYYSIGVEHLIGVTASTTAQKFVEAYFFSAQTFTTVGYGRINPTGYLTSFIAALEAFSGLLFFAVATGLFYARFSRPRAFLRFSKTALIAPYKDGIAFMCRLVPYKNNALTDVEVRVNVNIVLEENGKDVNKFYLLDLELSNINALSLNWTLVHPIDEKSPLYKLDKSDFEKLKLEVLVFLKGFDEAFSNTVVARASYTSQEIIFGAKFLPMFHRSSNGGTTVLEIDRLNSYERVDISSRLPVSVE